MALKLSLFLIIWGFLLLVLAKENLDAEGELQNTRTANGRSGDPSTAVGNNDEADGLNEDEEEEEIQNQKNNYEATDNFWGAGQQIIYDGAENYNADDYNAEDFDNSYDDFDEKKSGDQPKKFGSRAAKVKPYIKTSTKSATLVPLTPPQTKLLSSLIPTKGFTRK